MVLKFFPGELHDVFVSIYDRLNSLVSYGVSIVNILQKIDHVTKYYAVSN